MDRQEIEARLAIAGAMVDDLSDYLLGERLYHQIVVKTPLGTRQPKMTLGSLLESLEDLHWLRHKLDAAQQARLDDLAERVDVARGAFAGQWREFLQRELKALLGSWRWYLGDVARNAEARENYASEVHHRTRIDLVLRALADDRAIAEDRRELAQLDARLRPMLRSGGYVGPRDEEERYPPQQAWWLYGRLPGGD